MRRRSGVPILQKGRLVAGTLIAAAAMAPSAGAIGIVPLPTRVGVVVDWQPRSHTATVAMPGGKLLAIHTSRRLTAGTAVRVEGIKWGSRVQGIKWSGPPQGIKWHTRGGIKWGIKWLRNGTYRSRLTPVGRVHLTKVRGVVVARFGRRAVAISAPGTTFVVPLRTATAHRRVRRAAELLSLPSVGSTVQASLSFGPGGLVGTGLRSLHAPVAGNALPIAGRISSVATGTRTIVVTNDDNRQFVVRLRMVLPATFDLSRYVLGQEIAALAIPGPAGSFTAVSVTSNATASQADDPDLAQVLAGVASVTLPPGIVLGDTSALVPAVGTVPAPSTPPPTSPPPMDPPTQPVPPTPPTQPVPPTPPTPPGSGPPTTTPPGPPACAVDPGHGKRADDEDDDDDGERLVNPGLRRCDDDQDHHHAGGPRHPR